MEDGRTIATAMEGLANVSPSYVEDEIHLRSVVIRANENTLPRTVHSVVGPLLSGHPNSHRSNLALTLKRPEESGNRRVGLEILSTS